MIREDKKEEVKEILKKNSKEIAENLNLVGKNAVNILWISGEYGSDELKFSYHTQSTKPNPENWNEEKQFLIRRKRWKEAPQIIESIRKNVVPKEELEEAENTYKHIIKKYDEEITEGIQWYLEEEGIENWIKTE